MGTESMSDDELAAWMQAEHQATKTLTKVIREHIAIMPESNHDKWLDGLRAAFARLTAHLQRNFKAQESGGYLKFIIEQRPTLTNEVERIRSEHTELLRMADRIRVDLAEATTADRLLIADASARIQRFIAVVAQHDQRENMLTLFVFSQDIGSGE